MLTSFTSYFFVHAIVTDCIPLPSTVSQKAPVAANPYLCANFINGTNLKKGQ